MNLYELFRATAKRQPDQPALVGCDSDQVLSYAAADDAVRQASARLASAGVRPGACVGLHCASGDEYILATYAAWHCGACVMPLPIELTRPEKEQILQTVGVDFVISSPAKANFLAPRRTGEPAGIWPGIDLFPLRRQREHPPGFCQLDAAFVRFTSGTTAAAKGVVLSHQTVYERIQAANEVLQLGPKDRVVWLLSMAYHFAVTIVSYLSFGATIILPKNHFAEAVLAAARRHRATLIYGSPAHFTWLASASRAAPLPSLRLAISTTAPLDRATADAFHGRFGIPLTQALGIIEVGLPFINLRFADRWPDAIGELLPAYEVEWRETDLGDDAREILLRGPGLFDAYYEPFQTRAQILRDGWFHTGDVATQNADGCTTLRGRLKDVISVLGIKFFPQEVEAVLSSHPAVHGACVVARPDARFGEVPEARVVLRPGCRPPSVAELIAHCERELALFKVPRRIEMVESLPRTASGKLLHRTAK
jgi:long-chain acyl-CoA synthetase